MGLGLVGYSRTKNKFGGDQNGGHEGRFSFPYVSVSLVWQWWFSELAKSERTEDVLKGKPEWICKEEIGGSWGMYKTLSY